MQGDAINPGDGWAGWGCQPASGAPSSAAQCAPTARSWEIQGRSKCARDGEKICQEVVQGGRFVSTKLPLQEPQPQGLKRRKARSSLEGGQALRWQQHPPAVPWDQPCPAPCKHSPGTQGTVKPRDPPPAPPLYPGFPAFLTTSTSSGPRAWVWPYLG